MTSYPFGTDGQQAVKLVSSCTPQIYFVLDNAVVSHDPNWVLLLSFLITRTSGDRIDGIWWLNYC